MPRCFGVDTHLRLTTVQGARILVVAVHLQRGASAVQALFRCARAAIAACGEVIDVAAI